MNENIYAPPTTEPKPIVTDDSKLASRGSRLGASMIDSLIMMIFTIPATYLTGGFDSVAQGQSQSWLYTLAICALGLIIFFAINLKSLNASGQTIGKKVLDIKIVDMNGDLPTFKKHYIKRYATFFLPGQVPMVGSLFSFVNILFIFGKHRRCLHDLAGGTQVVDCDKE